MGPIEEKGLNLEDEDTCGGGSLEDSGSGVADDSIIIAPSFALAISFMQAISSLHCFFASATWLAKSIDCVSSIALT
jgi:hypothetical protein